MHMANDMRQFIIPLPIRRYESAVEYLSIKGQYDGLGGFRLVSTPLTDGELRNIRSPLDNLNWDKYLNKDKEEDKGLPF